MVRLPSTTLHFFPTAPSSAPRPYSVGKSWHKSVTTLGREERKKESEDPRRRDNVISHPLVFLFNFGYFSVKSWFFWWLSPVIIIGGKNKGETGIIKRVIRSRNRVILEGKNPVGSLVLRNYLIGSLIFDLDRAFFKW